jgi:serine/threonine-protein kinase
VPTAVIDVCTKMRKRGLPTTCSSGYREAVSRAGERIGEYRIVGEVARAATFTTYDAVHVVLPRRALVKVMSTTVQRIAVRALREAYFLETMQHPGVPRVYESGMLADRRPWFARELIEGPTLATLIGRRQPERLELIGLLRDVAEVLDHAHHHGLVHTRLRPDRIQLAKERAFPLCIADWSDARAHDAAGVTYVPLAGSWHYTAPELIGGQPADDRADVFSLGVMAYQLLTGTLPYDRGAIAMREGEGHHVPTEVRCPEAPPELTGVVDQMLSFDRWDRPTSGEVRSDLAWLVQSLSTSMLRIRKPRWTPELQLVPPEALDDYDQLEIDAIGAADDDPPSHD